MDLREAQSFCSYFIPPNIGKIYTSVWLAFCLKEQRCFLIAHTLDFYKATQADNHIQR